jgi:membrane dipeptidase
MTPVLALLAASLTTACGDKPAPLQDASDIATKTLIVDTHIDVPYRLTEEYEDVTEATANGDFDYPRARAGGLDVAFMSIYIPAEYFESGGGRKLADEMIDEIESIAARASDRFAVAHSTADVASNFAAGKISLALGMENGTGLDGDLANLDHFYARGIRYITLAHSKSNRLSDSSYDENRPLGGLSPLGREAVARMNALGMMIDISHLTDAAAMQVLELSAAPVIASHSSARKFTPGFERNMDDDLIRALARNGGVVQINFGSAFLTAESNKAFMRYWDAQEAFIEEHGYADDSPEVDAFEKQYKAENPIPLATLDDVLDHIDHVVAIAGIDHVGIGSDFDGVGDSLPEGLKDVSDYPGLVAGLLNRGYSLPDIEKICGANVMRVWRDVESRAAGS